MQNTLVPRYNWQSKKSSNDPKLGNFQMWLITPGQSLRSFNLLYVYIALTPSKILILALLMPIMLSKVHVFLIDYFCRHW